MTEPSMPPSRGALGQEGNFSQPFEGFFSATPLESCERYAAGHLTREQLVDELVRFPHAAVERDPFDDFSADPPGAWSELEDAEGRGLIDENIYEDVLGRRHPGPQAREQPE